MQSPDDAVLAALQLVSGLAGEPGGQFSITEYPDENELLQGIVLAGLAEQPTIDLVSKILLTAAGRPYEKPWVNLVAGLAQYAVMGLSLPASSAQAENGDESRLLEAVDLRVALEQTPVPLLLLEGPDHIVTFINDGYVQLLSRSQDQLLGLSIRDAMADLEGQPFFTWPDQTYRTGEPCVGKEVPCRMYSYHTQQMQDLFFDFVYHPVREASGEVRGILCQAADVTDRVLDRQVREAREQQLYQQWAELDTLYRTSPLPMAIIRARDLTILRLNEKEAALLGGRAEDLIGRRLEDFYPDVHFVRDVLRRVIRDKASCTLEVTAAAPALPGKLRNWTWSLHPILNGVGEVESIAPIALEMTEPPANLDGFLKEGELSGR